MEYLVISLSLAFILLFLWYVFQISIKRIKEIGQNQKLDELVNSLPENREVAKAILKMLNNKEVKIKENEDTKSSFYLVATNSILIANIKDSYTRIQTIAHECLHSVQEKKLLWFHYLFANFMILYYFIILILTAFGVTHNYLLHLMILAILFFIQYAVRSFLETDAMTKAPYLAKEYLLQTNLKKEEIEELDKAYQELDKEGIKTVCFQLLAKQIIKLIVYALVCFVVSVV